MAEDKHNDELMEVEEVAVSDGGVARFAPVDVQSGEEKYEVVWQETAKLLRFDEGENQWKERGQGTAKILRRKDEHGKYMFVFRREGIGKLAAQHYLLKSMTVKFHPQSEKALLWMAHKDYTDDEEGFPENFVMRFTSKELAEKALKAFKDAISASTV
ncbi:putative Ran-binding protein 1 [Trypanosoma cruzi]|uniref:Ran-binding protein 1, putative n=2 Tax=Trypanosoma cruzi TaxID=5693 RepID=Q4DSH6_TRYCC|nr:ran-binding protein 1, putative [Trypanosoma cruzi]EAN95469.1 ran-binding protein 1, putative [Trypanosoma cruzi]PWV12741.1 putative Ran-binding protein 1 [Trypanosoma cruzi]RNC59087.1 ran-binding protein 1 [Trypanosoma cruzi]|eukprot:XP_817320.1 ran-binding protein 1 [Trypanosoma cruzi strain CL Brener]